MALLAAVVATAPARARSVVPSCSTLHWVGSWAASPTDGATGADLYGSLPFASLAEQSYRMMIAPHRGGSRLRVHLSNRFGLTPTRFGHVTVGLRGAGPAVQPGTLRSLTFGGRPSVTAPPRGDVVSDPVDLAFTTSDQLAVSVYVSGPAPTPTEHNGAMSTQYLTLPAAGDATTSANGVEYVQRATSWIYLSGVDVLAPRYVSTVIALGDSITDGYDAVTLGSAPGERAAIDHYLRWPDALQLRLDAARLPIVAINAGISGNRMVRDQPSLFGPSALHRLAADVLEQAGVGSVIMVMGINDLGIYPPFATPRELIAGLSAATRRVQAHGLKMFLGTIPPASSAVVDGVVNNPRSDVHRREVNAWIRTQHLADGVFDFARALEDPRRPGDMRPEYQSGDHLHPSSLGNEVIAATVDLAALTVNPCRKRLG